MKITRTDCWFTVLDNYQPARSFTAGTLEWTTDAQGTPTGILRGIDDLKDPQKGLFLLDDGKSTRVMYVAGWSRKDPASEITAAADNLWLHDIPVNPDGARRSDNDQVIDYSGWHLGPRRIYHLKLSVPSFDTSDVFTAKRVDRAGRPLRVGSRVRVWPYVGETTLDYVAVIESFDFSEGPQAVVRPELEAVRRIYKGVEDLPTNLDRCELITF